MAAVLIWFQFIRRIMARDSEKLFFIVIIIRNKPHYQCKIHATLRSPSRTRGGESHAEIK